MCSNWCLALHIFCMIWCYLSHFRSPSVASQLYYLLKILQYEVQKNVEINEKTETDWSLGAISTCFFHGPCNLPLQNKNFKLSRFFFCHVLCYPVTLPLICTSQLEFLLNIGNLILSPVKHSLLAQHAGRLNFQQLPKLSKNYSSWPVVFTYLNVFVVLCMWCWKIYWVQKADMV